VKYDGKFASRWRAKSLDALCAVLPLLFRCVPTGAAKMKKEKFSYDYSCCQCRKLVTEVSAHQYGR
jgi:hypothetical protein